MSVKGCGLWGSKRSRKIGGGAEPVTMIVKKRKKKVSENI